MESEITDYRYDRRKSDYEASLSFRSEIKVQLIRLYISDGRPLESDRDPTVTGLLSTVIQLSVQSTQKIVKRILLPPPQLHDSLIAL